LASDKNQTNVIIQQVKENRRDNPEKLATLGIQDSRRTHTKCHMSWTLCVLSELRQDVVHCDVDITGIVFLQL
jgi:hypothetical protein